jgi:malate synthase
MTGLCVVRTQISKAREDVHVTESDLLAIPRGPRTEACLRNNCVVGVQYLEAWLGGLGCVPLYNLMEDAATAEICRTQVRTRSPSRESQSRPPAAPGGAW